MAQNAWDKADDVYNQDSSMLRVTGPAMRLHKTDKGYTYKSDPETNAWGVGGKVGRPRDVVKSMQNDEKDSMRKTAQDATDSYSRKKSKKQGKKRSTKQ